MAGAIPPGTDLTRTALGRNPDGSDPNFENPPTLAALTYGVTCTVMVLTSGVVGLRILSAIKKERSIKTDDCKSENLGSWKGVENWLIMDLCRLLPSGLPFDNRLRDSHHAE